MYEDDFHRYKYDRNGSQPGQRYDTRAPQQESAYSSQPRQEPVYSYQPQNTQEVKPVKRKKTALKTVALALVCALLGGAVGGGLVWGIGRGTVNETEVNISSRPAAEVVVHTVDGMKELSDAELYAANVNSVVSINVTGTSGTNFFGQPVQTASAGSGFVLTEEHNTYDALRRLYGHEWAITLDKLPEFPWKN